MIRNAIFLVVRSLAVLTASLFFQSCATNGYITSSVATVVGLDVSENPKTQIPHVRFGYARTGMYYVPTGKTTTPGQTDAGGSVRETPTLVSEIFVHSKFLDGITISEKFAIGEAAVQSSAAATTFADNSAHSVASNGSVVQTGGGVIPMIQPRARKAAKDVDIPLPSAAERRRQADRAREVVYSALEKLGENRKTPMFFETVMQGAPKSFERSEVGLTLYLDQEKDPDRITAIGGRIKNAR